MSRFIPGNVLIEDPFNIEKGISMIKPCTTAYGKEIARDFLEYASSLREGCQEACCISYSGDNCGLY